MNAQVNKDTLQQAKNGNLVAFERILTSFEKPLLNYLYRTVGQKEDAEDLTQETFVKIYKNLKNIDLESDFRAWVFTIATNTAYDWLRKRKGGKEISLDAEDVDFVANKESIIKSTNNIKALQDAFDVLKILDKLRPIYRTVLVLFYYQGFTYIEISKIISAPLNTVKTHMSRAKNSLKKILEAQEEAFKERRLPNYKPEPFSKIGFRPK